MISRRNFFKIAGLSTVAFGAGITAGKLSNNTKSTYYSIHGFIPADEQILSKIISSFRNKIKSNSEPVLMADSKFNAIINKIDLSSRKEIFSDKGIVTYRIKRLEDEIDSDLIFSDSNNSVFSIDDLNFTLFNLRNEIKNLKAEYLFTAEYKESDFFSSLMNSGKKELLIENEKGLLDRISLEKNYKNISVDGLIGKTGLTLRDGIVRVHSSSCKNGICKHSIAAAEGDVIACAPNKLLVRVVTA
ncbi:MAG: NusG domain II-containing protein [Ignavibacteriales bacterium]|nr:MAG: NusG domain II-containing protein [Ignavibacteriales bacterium]